MMNIVGVNPDAVLKTSLFNRRHGRDDAVHIWLGADEASLRILLSLPDQMLPGAEADLKPHFLNRRAEHCPKPALGDGLIHGNG